MAWTHILVEGGHIHIAQGRCPRSQLTKEQTNSSEYNTQTVFCIYVCSNNKYSIVYVCSNKYMLQCPDRTA